MTETNGEMPGHPAQDADSRPLEGERPQRWKVALEVAEDEFARFCELMDIDDDVRTMDDEDRKSFLAIRRPVIRALRKGALTIDDEGQPVYTLHGSVHNGDTLTFREHDGAALMETGGKGRDQDVRKLFAIMTAITRVKTGYFADVKGRDLKVCQGITSLFLG